MDAVVSGSPLGLQASGYSKPEFLRISQTVSAWNSGAPVVALGTVAALGAILPEGDKYRYFIDSDFVKVGYMRNFLGVDLMVLPQVADWTTPFGLKLSDKKIWFVSPSSQKIVKVVLEGNVLAYTSDVYSNANLLQTSTLTKSWGTAIATNSVAGLITLA